jgi:nucleoside-diphosphate-sugar epimerase
MMAIVHIDDAVAATVAALTAEPSVYNIVDDDPLPAAEFRLSPGGSMRRNRPA